jgi:catechol 2,3-dioxygenase-like lactoylglutathione lyase family enzyme
MDQVRIRGIHLCLPGYENGPTLEIFSYEPDNLSGSVRINRQGWGHIAFLVDSVSDVLAKVLEYGGSRLGKTITEEYHGVGVLTAVYARDPEGNIIEIQNWS